MKKMLLMFGTVIALLAITPAANAQDKGYKPGDVATDFRLKNVDGKFVSLSDYKKAKGFIIVFTCNHCPYAKAYEDRLIELDKKYAAKGFPMIAINPNDPAITPSDSYEAMQQRAKEKGFTFPYLFDEGQKIFPVYGATKTPHVFILNQEQGKYIVRYVGAIDDNYANAADVSNKYVEAAVNSLLSGEPVKQSQTVAIGCSIKYKK